VEAPRGNSDPRLLCGRRRHPPKVNLIVGTTNNHAAIAMSIRKAAGKLIQAGRIVEEGLLNRIEMAFRLYDPCLSCATHSLPGAMPLVVNISNHAGERIRSFRKDG